MLMQYTEVYSKKEYKVHNLSISIKKCPLSATVLSLL